MNKISENIFKKLAISVENKTDVPQRVALLRGYFDTLRVVPGEAGAVKKVYDDVTELQKNGFNVVAVSFDGEKANVKGELGIVFGSGDPNVTIEAMHRYLQTNPQMLRQLKIVANDQDAFDSDLVLTKASPLGNSAPVRIPLLGFFKEDQYQSDRITIDFNQNEVELSDDLVVEIVVAANAKMTFTFVV